MNNLLLERMERIENFCFMDTPERASLETVTKRLDAHLAVMCDYARLARFTVLGLAALAASVTAIVHAVGMM